MIRAPVILSDIAACAGHDGPLRAEGPPALLSMLENHFRLFVQKLSLLARVVVKAGSVQRSNEYRLFHVCS